MLASQTTCLREGRWVHGSCYFPENPARGGEGARWRGADRAEGLWAGGGGWVGAGTGCSLHMLSALTLVSSFCNRGNKFKVCDIFLEFAALSLISLTPEVFKDRIRSATPGTAGLWAGWECGLGRGWPENSSSVLPRMLLWPGAHTSNQTVLRAGSEAHGFPNNAALAETVLRPF